MTNTETPTNTEALLGACDLMADADRVKAARLRNRLTMAATGEEFDIAARSIEHNLDHVIRGETPCGYDEC